MNTDFSFIIKGPYSENHLQMIDELKKYGKVIISTEKKYIDQLHKNIKHYDKICLFEEIDIANIYNYQNIFRHAYSILQGLKISDTKYCVNMRSDHSYSNVNYILEIIKNNELDKYICDNCTINPTMPFHLSDSILGGKKETLIGVCETLIKSIISKDFIYEGIDIRIRAEVAFFASYLKYKKISIKKEHDIFFWDSCLNNEQYIFPGCRDYVKFISNNAQLIDVKKLQPCVLKYNNISVNLDETWDKTDNIIWSFWSWSK
jgi:hypothetical protein